MKTFPLEAEKMVIRGITEQDPAPQGNTPSPKPQPPQHGHDSGPHPELAVQPTQPRTCSLRPNQGLSRILRLATADTLPVANPLIPPQAERAPQSLRKLSFWGPLSPSPQCTHWGLSGRLARPPLLEDSH